MDRLKELEMYDRDLHKMQMRILYGKFDGNQMHPAQFTMMMFLQELRCCSQTDLAKRASVSNASVGISLRRLEKIGFVHRESDEKDSRIVNVTLTEKGRQYTKEALEAFDSLAAIKYAGFSEKDVEIYRSLLQRIIQNFQNTLANQEGKPF